MVFYIWSPQMRAAYLRCAYLRQEKSELERTVVDHENTISDLSAKLTLADELTKDLEEKISNLPNGSDESPPPELQDLQDELDSTNQYARRGAYTLSGKNNELPIFDQNESSKAIVIDKILNTQELSWRRQTYLLRTGSERSPITQQTTAVGSDSGS